MNDATPTPPAAARSVFLAGLQAGMMAVLVMLAWLGVSNTWQGRTFWTAPNQMATLLHGGAAIVPGFGRYTASGIALYVVFYCLLGAAFAIVAPRRLAPMG